MPVGTSTVNFGAVEVNGPSAGGTQIRSRARHVTDETADLTRFAYQTTSTKKDLWTLPLSEVTDEQKSALQTFFDDTAQGPANTFSYTHTDGQTYTARFVDTELSWSRRSKTWDCTVRIEVSQRIND